MSQLSNFEIVGALLCLSVVTRVDVAFTLVGVLTRHMKKPTHDLACSVPIAHLFVENQASWSSLSWLFSWSACLH